MSAAGGSRRLSVHGVLGGGAVADVLLWRRRNVAAFAAGVATVVWFLFERAGYNLLSVVVNSLLLLVAILFFWAQAARLLNRPLPPLPNLELPDAAVEKVANEVVVIVNHLLAVAQDIAIKRDRTLFFKIIVGLWVVSYIGRWFNFLTLLYIGFMFCLTVPVLYDKYQDPVDEKIGVAHTVVMKQLDNIVGRSWQPAKQKKTE